MEIPHFKSTEDQMEMMMLMNPDLYLPNQHDVVSSSSDPSLDHHNFTTTSVTNTSNCTISFSNNIIHEASLSNEPKRSLLSSDDDDDDDDNSHNNKKIDSMAAMREMIFRMAAMQPINIDPESVKPPPKRRNVKISQDPQSVAARQRRERISERIRILRRLVPGGSKMDTASMLDEAIHYVKFLKNQVQSLERAPIISTNNSVTPGIGFPVTMSNGSYANHHHHHQYHHQPPPPPPFDHPDHQGLQQYGAT